MNPRTLLLTAALVATSVPALAAPPPTAEKLFNAGREAKRRGDEATACAHFAAADALGSTFGTLSNLAECAEGKGDWVTSRRYFRRAFELTNDDRRSFLLQRIAAAEAHLARLQLPEAARDIMVDGASGEQTAPGSSILFVNPGTHLVIATIDGVSRSEKCSGAVGQLAVCLAPAEKPVEIPVAPKSASSSTATAGKVVLVVGAAAVLTGVVFGGLAYSGRHAAEQCTATPAGRVCPDEGTKIAAERAQLESKVATYATIGGLALVGAGSIVWVAAGPSSRAAGIQFTGTF